MLFEEYDIYRRIMGYKGRRINWDQNIEGFK